MIFKLNISNALLSMNHQKSPVWLTLTTWTVFCRSGTTWESVHLQLLTWHYFLQFHFYFSQPLHLHPRLNLLLHLTLKTFTLTWSCRYLFSILNVSFYNKMLTMIWYCSKPSIASETIWRMWFILTFSVRSFVPIQIWSSSSLKVRRTFPPCLLSIPESG